MVPTNNAPDAYIRIPLGELVTLNLYHVDAAIDPSIAVHGSANLGASYEIAGYTQWAGTWRQAQVSIGWDWAVARDLIVVLNPADIRTNLLVAEVDCSKESLRLSRIYLLERIEKLPWRTTAIPDLLAQHAGCSTIRTT
jgi:hypothetical protein